MAWLMIRREPKLGGPCKRPCQHRDCAETRALVARVCPYCSQPIGYELKFTGDPPVHFDCALDAAERLAEK